MVPLVRLRFEAVFVGYMASKDAMPALLSLLVFEIGRLTE
jgi:hypothetical protein